MPWEVRNESSASGQYISSPEERPLSLVVDITNDNRAICQFMKGAGMAGPYLLLLEHPVPILDILLLYAQSRLGSFSPPLELCLVLILHPLGISLETLRHLSTGPN